MIADIVIFSPEPGTDRATGTAGEQDLPTTGITHLILNGQVVVRDSIF